MEGRLPKYKENKGGLLTEIIAEEGLTRGEFVKLLKGEE